MGSLVAELAEKLSSATNNFDIDEGTIYVNTSADTVGIGTTTPGSKLDVQGTMQVGVDDTGHDVKFFGATAGAYLEWDESADELEIRGGAATPGKLLLSTAETTVVDGNKLGQIDFQAPLDSAGTDAILVGASIYAEADATFSSSVNATELVFATGASESATEKVRITSGGNVGIGNTNPGDYNASINDLVVGNHTGSHGITIATATDATGYFAFADGSSTAADEYRGLIEYDHDNNKMHLRTDAVQRLSIDSSGKVGIGTTSPAFFTQFVGAGTLGSGTIGGVLQLQDTAAYNATQYSGISFAGKYHSNGAVADFCSIRGIKENSTDNNFAGMLTFHTRENGGNGTERMRITSAGRVGIGSASPNEKLDVAGAIMSTAALGNHQTSAFVMHQVDSATSELRAYGADASTAGVLRLRGYANDGSPFNSGITLAADGNVGIGTTVPGYRLEVREDVNDWVSYVKNGVGGSGQVYGFKILYVNRNPDDNSSKAIEFTTTGGDKFQVYSDGDVRNHDNSYGAISDERIKTDIVDANSQWDDVKAIRVRNFKRKDDVVEYGDKAWTQLGVIAQEVEKVSPKLIKEQPPSEWEMEHCGFGKKVGGKWVPKTVNGKDMTVKNMNYSILQMKAFKALQEAMTKIETLEAKVKALESA